jgi:CRP-like cAMP-binding protein
VTTKDHLLHFKKFLQQQFQLTEEESDMTKEYFQLQSFPKNEYFVSQGKVCRKLAFIAEGVMRYCMFRDDGTEVTCFFMCENDFVGDPESFFSQKPADKNAQALTDSRLITISYENMQKLIQQVSRGNEINAAIDHYVMMKMLYQRTFLLNLDATVRYKEFMREYAHILQRIPLSYIANFLGITQQSLSRLRKQMPLSSIRTDSSRSGREIEKLF